MAPPVTHNPNDTTLIASDEEDDDFQLSDRDDDGGSDSDDSEAESRRVDSAKRQKLDETPAEPLLTKTDVDDLWASFNAPDEPIASTSSAALGSSTTKQTSSIGKKITITVSYKFVGETVYQEKEVLADSDEARIWLASQPRTTSTTAKPSLVSQGKQPSTSTSAIDALFGSPSIDAPLPSTSTASAADAPIVTAEEVARKVVPPKRARGGGLMAMSAALKAPKLNTLEKSKLDWNNFVTKEDLKDDLSKARKDGYLDKQDFLQRTEDRREYDYEKTKSLRNAKR